jgi:hypothetical protein
MNIRTLVATLLLIAAGSTAQAASLTTLDLVPSAGTVVQNSTFTVDLVLNAANAPGSHPGLTSGQIIVDFDKTKLTYNSFTLGSGLNFVPLNGAPVVAISGNTQTVYIWFENAPDISTIGRFSFKAIGTPGSLATLGLVDADTFFGSSFVNKAQTDTGIFDLRFAGTAINITAVPLPAGVWLLGTALGALAARRRLRRTAA